MSDPKRLLSTANNIVERAILESGMMPGPTNPQCDAVWVALERRLALGNGGGSSSKPPSLNGANGAGSASAAPTVSQGAVAWGAAAVAVGAAGLTAFFALSTPRLQPAQGYVSSPIHPTASQVLASDPPITPSAPSGAPAWPPAPSAVAVVPSHVAHPRASHKEASQTVDVAPPPEAPESSLREESQLLLNARHAWQAQDCEGALAQLEQARNRFPSGALVQEREALSIEALACAGRTEEASTRAARFLRDYPTSPHAEAIRRFQR